jgi:hypothetical protein
LITSLIFGSFMIMMLAGEPIAAALSQAGTAPLAFSHIC